MLLDAAGTLIRPRDPVGETYAAAARQFGAEIDPGQLSRAFGAVFDHMPALAFDWTSMDELRHLERDWWRTLVGRVVARTGCDIRDFDGYFETLYQHYARGSAWECFPEVPAVLKALRAGGRKLAVVSNFDSRLPGILQDLGIRDQMDAVIYSSGAGSAKPDPAIFRQALVVLGVASQSAIHVGDSARADVAGAAAAGIAGLLIRRGHAAANGSETVIGSLAELLVRLGGGNY